MKKWVKISKGVIDNQPALLIYFKYSTDLIIMAKKAGALWSPKERMWHVPFSVSKLQEVKNTFGQVCRVYCHLDSERKKKNHFSKLSRGKPSRRVRKTGAQQLNPKSKKLLHDFVKYLRGKLFSESTVKTYYIHILDLLIYLKNKPLEEICNRDVELFIEDVCLKRCYSVSTHRQVISAVKHFAQLQDCQIDNPKLESPRKSRFLPTVLSKQEVVELLRNTRNIKHRTIIALLYSSGLRIGELIDLELGDIDADRRQIIVKNGKGRKDRYVILAESFIMLMDNYLFTYQPKKYFIESTKPGIKYSATSVRSFLKATVKRAGIRKRITPHTLRHSYATHLLEQGVDIRYIQELLGHARPETTMVYTHVRKQNMLHITSPFDTLARQLNQPIDQPDKNTNNPWLSRDDR